MYKSIKSWINLPAVLKSYEKRNGSGTKLFKESVDILCYAEGKVQVVTNNEGAEITSSKQLYVEGNTDVKELDNIVFESSERPVVAVGTFYRNGEPDLKVVYL